MGFKYRRREAKENLRKPQRTRVERTARFFEELLLTISELILNKLVLNKWGDVIKINLQWNRATPLKVSYKNAFITGSWAVLEKVKTSLNARGVRTIRGMGRSFRIVDNNGDRKIDKQEFYWGLKDLGADVSKREALILLDHLDLNKDGVVSYDEFLYGIRGMPNATRQDIINAAFRKFDLDGNGTVTSADLRTVYNC